MNPKQEILKTLHELEGYDEAIDCSRIRAILETHTLEQIDDREFDPALCGFKLIKSEIHRINGYRVWVKDWLEITKFDDGHGEIEFQPDRWEKSSAIRFPWPKTQSDGERLLKLLGVLG